MKVEKTIQRKNETKNRKNKIDLAHFFGALQHGHGHSSLMFRAKCVERRGKKFLSKNCKR